VNITEDATNILASGVDQIRFIYTVPNPSGGGNPGPTIREVDVFGVATIPEPSSFLLCGLGFIALLISRRR
jgi:PEP-CTERM motif